MPTSWFCVVDQRPARVARVDRRVGLHHVLVRADRDGLGHGDRRERRLRDRHDAGRPDQLDGVEARADLGVADRDDVLAALQPRLLGDLNCRRPSGFAGDGLVLGQPVADELRRAQLLLAAVEVTPTRYWLPAPATTCALATT